MKLIAIALLFVSTSLFAQEKFNGKELTKDTTQLKGVTVYTDSAGEKYYKIIVKTKDGIMVTESGEVLVPIPLTVLSQTKYTYIQTLIQSWQSQNDYLLLKEKLLQLDKEVK